MNKPKAKKGANLRVILKEALRIWSVNDEGKLTYAGLGEGHDISRLLSHSIDFGSQGDSLDKVTLVNRALKSCLVRGNNIGTVDDYFLKCLSDLVRESLATSDQELCLVTSISLDFTGLTRRYKEFSGCSISLYPEGLPKKYISREKVIERLSSTQRENATPKNYTIVVVKTKARSLTVGWKRCLEALDLFRGIFNMLLNSSNIFWGETYKPINKVLVGKIHTLHNAQGRAFDHPVLYDPKFYSAISMEPPKARLTQYYFSRYRNSIQNSKFSKELQAAIIRYSNALDESIQDVAVLKLWATLESLLLVNNEDGQKLSLKLSSLYSEPDLQYEYFEHIRKYRNANVHSAIGDDDSIHRAYKLQEGFYYLFIYYVHERFNHLSLKEANALLLDCSESEYEIEKKLKRVRETKENLSTIFGA